MLAVTLVILGCMISDTDSPPPPEPVQVKIIDTVGDSFTGKCTILEKQNGERFKVSGIWGDRGDKFLWVAEKD
jgi:hypothetical protein